MSYYSEIAIVISGKFDQLQQFVNYLLNSDIRDDDKLLTKFKFVDIDDNLTVLALYLKSQRWTYEAETFWERIRNEAKNAQLPCLFRRLGERFDDIEQFYDCELEGFNKIKNMSALLNLIHFERRLKLSKKLAYLFKK